MANEIVCKVLDTQTEQPNVLPLLARCFPAYWEQTAAQNKEFPFEEISIGAFVAGQLVGHFGIIPQCMSEGNGHYAKVAGVASVAVLPECRGRGIARELGSFAREWAKQNGYDMMTLYTGKPQVYVAAGFVDYANTPAKTLVFAKQGTAKPKSGAELTESEKAEIMRLYEQGEDYKGRLMRGQGREFNGWKRLFQDPEYAFAVGQGIYATFYYDVLAECCFDLCLSDDRIFDFINKYALQGNIDVSLHSESRVWKAVARCKIQPCQHDIMHGEHPMILPLKESCELSHLHFNLADKF